MPILISLKQFSNFAIRLSAQSDYQALTHEFLKILAELSGITNAVAYEIHGQKRRRAGEASNIYEQLVRRFPLDFSREDTEKCPDNLSGLLENIEDIRFGNLIEPKIYQQCLLMLKVNGGPDFAILVEGRVCESYFPVLQDLREIYFNQMLLHHSKERDVLTKLPNRQSLTTRLLQVCEYYRSLKTKGHHADKESWIALLDIDHFKRVNDTFGHLYGDEVLLTFSQIMRKEFRYNDFLFRYGGEEFVVILNLTDRAGAIATFNRFRTAVVEYVFPTVGNVSVSIGFTHINTLAMPTSLLDQADKALYYAKEHGRNQVVLYEEIFSQQVEQDTSSEIELF